jgi:pyruvate dehydrogenase E1 component beta subunit
MADTAAALKATSAAQPAVREITYAAAICEAISEEMTRDENVFVIGEDVALLGGTFKCTAGLYEKFGEWRVRDTPISEPGFIGMAIGCALLGMRPIVDLSFNDFLTVAMDQICNQAAKLHYMSGGALRVPLTIRASYGAGRSQAAQHSQSLQAWFAHLPGLKVVMPSDAAEAKGLLKTAIRDDNPVVFLDHKLFLNKVFKVPEGDYTIPFGKAKVARVGGDLTIAATGGMVLEALQAAEALATEGMSVEVIDIRSIVPLDKQTIADSVKKTGRLVVADEGHLYCGVAAEITAMVQEEVFYYLDAPIARVCTPNIMIPFSPALELPLIPKAKHVYEAAKKLLR